MDRARIEVVDPAVGLTDAGGWFDGEIRDTWPPYTARAICRLAPGPGTREDRDRLLTAAEIILGGCPFPLDLRARAPQLKWFHQRPAGASNLARRSLGQRSDRDDLARRRQHLGDRRDAVAGILYFAKALYRVAIDRAAALLSPRAYRPLLLDGKIGWSSARAASAGMSAGCARGSACGSSAPAACRGRSSRCRPGSANLAAPSISTVSCRTATLS